MRSDSEDLAQHDDRNVRHVAHSSRDLLTGEVRQLEVENDEVWALAQRGLKPTLACLGV